MYTISARQLQREYKKVLQKAKKINKPIVVISNNKPQGAIISLNLLEKLEFEHILSEAFSAYKKGQTKTLSSEKDIEKYLDEIEEEK